MHTTSVSLLEQLRGAAEPKTWARLVELYSPLIYYWARKTGLQEHDAADLVQDVFAVLLQKLPEFAYDRQGSFRSWLRTVTLNKWRENNRHRAGLPLEPRRIELDNLPDDDDADPFWEDEYRQQLVGRAMELMRTDFQESLVRCLQAWTAQPAGRNTAQPTGRDSAPAGDDAVVADLIRRLSDLARLPGGLADTVIEPSTSELPRQEAKPESYDFLSPAETPDELG